MNVKFVTLFFYRSFMGRVERSRGAIGWVVCLLILPVLENVRKYDTKCFIGVPWSIYIYMFAYSTYSMCANLIPDYF